MLKRFLQASLVSFIITSFILVGSVFALPDKAENSSTNEPLVQTSVTAEEVVYEPVRIVIPSIDVDVQIEPVGEDKQGNMDVPSDYENAGWWEYGSKPGEMGSAVIAGHIDTPTAQPGIFYNLVEMAYGDQIIVYDQHDNEYVFEVTEIIEYENNEFPIDLVFARDDAKRLNLITCAGVFDISENNYDKRTVVYARMVE